MLCKTHFSKGKVGISMYEAYLFYILLLVHLADF